MGLKKYKYYFKKPKSEIVKDILKSLLITGTFYVAGSSPTFIKSVLNNEKWRKYPKKKVQDAFYRLKKCGFIVVERKNHQIYIRLTKEGRKKAGWMQVDALRIKNPKKWDHKWRLIIFDIAQLKKIYRDTFRQKLKELGFSLLQKSVWVHPFDCEAEIELLKDFFGLSEKEIRIIVAEKIGNDVELKKRFKLI